MAWDEGQRMLLILRALDKHQVKTQEDSQRQPGELAPDDARRAFAELQARLAEQRAWQEAGG